MFKARHSLFILYAAAIAALWLPAPAEAFNVTGLDGNTIQARANIDRRGLVLGEDTHPITQKSDRHAHTENGQMFYHNGLHGALLAASTYDHLIKVGATPIHLIQIETLIQQSPVAGLITVTLYASPTTTADGTPATVLNRNRNFADTPPATVFEVPTVTAVGTELETLLLSGSIQGGRGPGQDEIEWILQANTNYLIRLSTANALDNFEVNLEYYAEAADTPLP